MAIELHTSGAREITKFRVRALKTRFVNKTVPLYVEPCVESGVFRRSENVNATWPPAGYVFAKFLSHVTPRQVRVAVDYLEGLTQEEIAEAHEISQATVARELEHVRRVAERFGRSLPKSPQLIAAREVQMSERLYRSL